MSQDSTLWIGNVAIPFLTSQDYQQEREVVQKNFVGYSPQIYEFEPRLETGTFSFMLIDGAHPDSLSLTEQRDAFTSLSDFHPTQNAFEVLEDKGYLSFSNISTTREPNLMSISTEAEAFYLEDADYRPAWLSSPETYAENFGLSPNAHVALHPSVSDVIYRDSSDGSTTQASPAFTINSEHEALDIYNVSGGQLVYENPTSDGDFARPERRSIVNAIDSGGSPVNSEYADFESGSFSNGPLGVEHTDNGFDLWFRNDGWKSMGSLSVGADSPIIEEMDNHYIRIGVDNGYIETQRGAPFLRFKGTFSTFVWNTLQTDNPAFDYRSEGDYALVGLGSPHEIFISRDSQSGSLSGNNYDMGLLNASGENTVTVGFAPNGDTAGMIEWSQTDGHLQRNLLAREEL